MICVAVTSLLLRMASGYVWESCEVLEQCCFCSGRWHAWMHGEWITLWIANNVLLVSMNCLVCEGCGVSITESVKHVICYMWPFYFGAILTCHVCHDYVVSCPDPTLSQGKRSSDHWVISWFCRVSKMPLVMWLEERNRGYNQEIAQWSPDPYSRERVGSGHETNDYVVRLLHSLCKEICHIIKFTCTTRCTSQSTSVDAKWWWLKIFRGKKGS